MVSPVFAIEVTERYTRCDFDEDRFMDECETEIEFEEVSISEQILLNQIKENFTSYLIQKDGHKAIEFVSYYEFSPNKIKIKGWIPQATQNYWGIEGIWNSTWWNATFERCQNISIGAFKENYVAVINISKAVAMENDFKDVRFVNTSCNNNGTLLDWFERSIDVNWATYDLRFQNSSEISMYYDNNTPVESGSSKSGVWGANLSYYFIKDDYTGTGTFDIGGTGNEAWINTPDWIDSAKFGGLNYSAVLTVNTHAGDCAGYESPNLMTFSTWITRHGDTPQFTRVIDKLESGSPPYTSYGLFMYGQAGSVNEPLCVWGSGAVLKRVYFNTTLVDHQLYLIHCVYNTTHIMGYLNGTLDTIIDAYSSTVSYTSGNLTFGNRVGDASQFTGELDEVMFWKSALTPTFISNMYTDVQPYFTFDAEEENPDAPEEPEANLTNGTYINYSCSGNYSLTNATTISGDTNTSVLTYIYCKNGCNEANLIITIWGNEASMCNPEIWLQVIYFITVVAVIVWGIRRLT